MKQIMQEIVSNVIFVFSKYHVMSFLCHHAENFCLRHFVPEVCRAIVICVDRNRIIANRVHVTIEYTFDLAVHNVERLNVSRFVTFCHGGAYVSTQILLKLNGIADF